MDIREYARFSHNGQDWTEAFRAALKEIRSRGGGVLTVSPGEYPTGPIRLFSHTTLELLPGAVLRFHQRADAFPLIPLEFEGIGGQMYMPCIFAEDAEDITVTGGGTADGQGDFWWRQVREGTLPHPRPYLLCFSRCSHVTVENVTLCNSPCWTVHPLRCKKVVLQGLTILNPPDSPNTDGINPDACRDVRIQDCVIDVGDDCIAIKSGTEDTEDRLPCEDIVISGCRLLHGHGGIVMGSEMSGGIRNVTVSDCVFAETDRGVRLKTRRGRGGTVENIRMNRLVMERVMCPFVFNMYYGCGTGGDGKREWDKNPWPVDETTPVLRDVHIAHVQARQCTACAGFFYGLPEMPVEGVTLQDVTVEMAPDGQADCPAMMKDCPRMQGEGFFLRNVKHADLRGVRVIGAKNGVLNADESVTLAR